MVKSDYDGLLLHNNIATDASDEMKEEIFRPKIQLYEDYKYPGTIWLYDTASFLFDADGETDSNNAHTLQTLLDSMAGLWPQPSPVPPARRLLHNENDGDVMRYLFKLVQTSLHQQCSHKQKPFSQIEFWNNKAYSGMDVPVNAYNVNLWGLLMWIYLVSVLFQWWRAWNYGNRFQPVGPDALRWFEYLLSSPLMLIIVAMSVMIRDVSTIVLLVFLQMALIVMGYMLEFMIDDYLTFSKYKYFAKIYGEEPSTCGLGGMNRSGGTNKNNASMFTLKLSGTENLANVTDEQEKLLLSKTRNIHEDDKAADKHALIDLFLEKTFRPGACSNMLSQEAISQIGSRLSTQIAFVFFLAFSTWGVIWSVILARLIRQNNILKDCVCHSGGCPSIPVIVWVIVLGQMLSFLSFGVNLGCLWLYYLRKFKEAFKKPDISSNPPLSKINNVVEAALKEFKTKMYEAWVFTAFIFSVLNFLSKFYLEITILFYITTLRTQLDSV